MVTSSKLMQNVKVSSGLAFVIADLVLFITSYCSIKNNLAQDIVASVPGVVVAFK